VKLRKFNNLRLVHGKTVIAKRALLKAHEQSEAQKNTRRRFLLGSQYAKKILQDPIMKEAYASRAKPGQSPYNVALADYMTAPEIAEVNLSAFKGTKGSTVTLQVIDDYEVTEVKVAIYDHQSGLVEEGMASLADNDIDWEYTTQKALTKVSGSSILVQASDLPDNISERTEVLS
jgi:hypothetical protein